MLSGSVAGLNKAGDVRFNGIPVGQVKEINIFEEDPRLVQVIVGIETAVPITVDAIARLASQGLTGVSYIEITSGVDDEPLGLAVDQIYRRIPSQPSTLQGLLTDVPAAIGEVRSAAEKITIALNSENQQKLSDLLTNLVAITDDVASVSGATVGNFSAASARLADASVDVELLLSAAGEFSVGTLPEISSLVIDLRRLASAFTGIATDLDQNATEAIFGTKYPEYLPE